MKIKELKVLNMTEPCGIGDSPYFSWINRKRYDKIRYRQFILLWSKVVILLYGIREK